MSTHENLFIGIYPMGIVYANRACREAGDYKRVGFLEFETLQLTLKEDAPAALRAAAAEDAAEIIGRRGARFPVSACGQSVVLGGAVQV